METGDFASFESPEFAAAQGTVDPWMFEHCEFDQKEEVTASEYKFEGLPTSSTPGRPPSCCPNDGAEAHEMAIMRKADGVTQSWEEILALPQEEAEALVVQVGGTFAPNKAPRASPSSTSCPATTWPRASCRRAPRGERRHDHGGHRTPHFMHGMISEFTVTE